MLVLMTKIAEVVAAAPENVQVMIMVVLRVPKVNVTLQILAHYSHWQIKVA
jgi:hypothetical protein